MKQLNNIRQFSVILLLLSLLPLYVQAQTTEAKEYSIIDDIADLSDGDHIIIVSQKYQKAMIGSVYTNNINDERLKSTEVILNDNKTIAKTDSKSAIFTLVKTNGKFNFRSSEGKYVTNVATGKDNKNINLSDKISETTEAEISFQNSKADIFFEKDTPKYLYFISNSKLYGMSDESSTSDMYHVYIYKLSSEQKTKTRISFGEEAKDTYNITYGTTDFVFPKANVYADDTTMSDAKISYTSSNTTIATVDNDGNVTINNNNQYGETTITADYLGDDNHYACSASYTIKVTEKKKTTTELSFGEGIDHQTIIVKANEEDHFAGAKAVLSPVENGEVTYSSSNENVATVDNEGKIRFYNIGETVISANYAGNETYAASTTSYNLQYIGERIVFASEHNSFNKIGTSLIRYKSCNFIDSLSNSYTWNIGEGRCTKENKGVLELSAAYNAKAPILKAANGYKLMVLYYQKKGNTMKLTIKADEHEIDTQFKEYVTKNQDKGTGYKVTGKIDSSTAFSITAEHQAFISRIQIDINPIYNITLDETEDNSKIISAHKGQTVNALPIRTLVADKWNTFCIPFNINVADGKLCGIEAEIREYDHMEGDVMMFKEAKEIVAGRPYLIRPNKDIKLGQFDNVRLTGPELEKSGDESFYMIGTYSNRTFSEEESSKYLFLNANAEFRHPKPGTTMKGMRAYFYCSPDVQASQMRVGFSENSTDIKDIEQSNIQANLQRIYTINGSYVGTDKAALPKGIYIIGGKKYIK